MGSPSHPTGGRPADTDTLVARALRESLQSIAHPCTAEPLLRRALCDCGELDVPAGGERLQRFVEVVSETVRLELGDAEADALALDLQRILSRAPDDDEISRVRPVTEAPEPLDAELPVPDLPFEEVPGPAPRTVLLASRTASRAAQLAEHLPSTWPVRAVSDALALLDAAATGNRAPVIVLDCDHPSVQPSTLGALEPELPAETRIVVWGASATDLEDLRHLSPPAHEWTASEPGATEADVAALIVQHET